MPCEASPCTRRIAAVAGADEILVSEATHMLAAGGAFTFDARGPFILKGLPGLRTLFAADAKTEAKPTS